MTSQWDNPIVLLATQVEQINLINNNNGLIEMKNTSRLSLERIKNFVQNWKALSQSRNIEIAALEPMLWNDSGFNVVDLVSYLKDNEFIVKMTTNGSLLAKYAMPLKSSGIDLVRISWHSMDEKLYHIITGGGKLSLLLSGIEKAVNCNLPMSFNRVLMKGYLNDLPEHIDFIDKYALRLKLLDLYWTEDSQKHYDDYYISPEEALKGINTLMLDESYIHQYGRNRIRYLTSKGGIVEYKLKETANRSPICNNCDLSSNCLEGFGDYLRLYPNGQEALCYLRDDLATSCFDSNGEFQLDNEFYQNYLSQFISNIPLRLVIEGRCNFNCGFPTSKNSWCLKQGKGFYFPRRKEILIKNVE